MGAETITEGKALYQGEQLDGSHDILVQITVLHADPSMNYQQEVVLRVDPSVFGGVEPGAISPIVRVRKQG